MMSGPFDVAALSASVAANLATTILQAHVDRLQSRVFTRSLRRLGLLRPNFHDKLHAALSTAISEHLGANPDYNIKGVTDFFVSDEVCRLIGEYLLDGRQIDRTVILGYLADSLNVPRDVSLHAWPNGFNPLPFWDGFEIKLSHTLGLMADPGTVWIGTQLTALKNAVYKDVTEQRIFRQKASALFGSVASSTEHSEFEDRYLSHLASRTGRLVTPGARDLQGISQSLSIAYISLNVKTTSTADVASAEDFLQNNARIIIRGPAGSGKTTLTNWIAWSCSNNDKDSVWSGGIPFVVPLRRVAVDESGPPKVANFVRYSVDLGVWSMETPVDWIDQILRVQKRGVIILDGVDELPAARRAAFWEWLADFVIHYAGNRIVVTSRTLPGSASSDGQSKTEQWNPPSEFVECQLEDMSDGDVGKFVLHWHNAIDKAKLDPFEVAALVKARDDLPRKLSDPANRRIRELCSTPLLCALICVLHWHDEGYLPRQRVEIYNRCCDMLIEARDLKRGIQPPAGALGSLSKDDKELVLQRLAYDMLRNQPDSDESTTTYRIEISRSKAVEWIGLRVSSFQSADARNVSPSDVLDFLIERTGLLREPSGGRIDFPHRTFQEYLAACAAGAEGGEVALAKQADDDQWHETIMLAAGTPTGGIQFGRALIEALVKRGEQHKSAKAKSQRVRKTCFALALGCLENLRQQDPQIRERVVSHISDLVPPHNQGDARILSVAGDAAVGFLRYSKWKDERTSTLASCAQALRLIATTSAAQELASGYIGDSREPVVAEVCASGFFAYDQIPLVAQYVRLNGRLPSYAPTNNLQNLTKLSELKGLDLIGRIPDDISGLRRLPNLTDVRLRELSLDEVRYAEFPDTVSRIDLIGCSGSGFEWLKQVKNLRELKLVGHDEFVDAGFLQGLPNLLLLTIDAAEIEDLSPIGLLPELQGLSLDDCQQLKSLSALVALNELSTLNIIDCRSLTDFSPLSGVGSLKNLTVERCSNGAAAPDVGKLLKLERLSLSGMSLRTTQLSELTALSDLRLSAMRGVAGLDFLTNLKALRRLTVQNCHEVTSIEPLAECSQIEAFRFTGGSVTSLDGLKSCSRLTSLLLQDCAEIQDFSQLSNLSNLTELRLIQLPGLGTLESLKDLKSLRSIYLERLVEVGDLSILSGLPTVEEVSLLGCRALTDLSPLSKLQALRSVTVMGCPKVVDLSPLENCRSLEVIRCSRQDVRHFTMPDSLRPKVTYPYYFSRHVPHLARQASPHFVFTDDDDRPAKIVYYEHDTDRAVYMTDSFST